MTAAAIQTQLTLLDVAMRWNGPNPEPPALGSGEYAKWLAARRRWALRKLRDRKISTEGERCVTVSLALIERWERRQVR